MSANFTKPTSSIANNNNNNGNDTSSITHTLSISSKLQGPFSKESNITTALPKGSHDFSSTADPQSRHKQSHTVSTPDSYRQGHQTSTTHHQSAEMSISTDLSGFFLNSISRPASTPIAITQTSATSTSAPRPYKSSNLNQVTLPHTPDNSPINQTFRNVGLRTPSMRAPSSRNRESTAGSSESSLRKSGGGWPLTNIRSFDLPSAATGNLISNGIPLDRNLRINNHSFSSSEDEYNGGYDSDDLMSMGSRRPSISMTFPDEPAKEAIRVFHDFDMPESKSKQLEFTIPLPKMDSSRLRNLPAFHSLKQGEDLDNSTKPHINSDGDEPSIRSAKKRSIANFATAVDSTDSGDADSSTGRESRSLRPKAKSFLRISRALEDEMSPFDHEIRQEARVTHSLKTDARNFTQAGTTIPNASHNIKHHRPGFKSTSLHAPLDKDTSFDPDYFKHNSSKLLQLNSAFFKSSQKMEVGDNPHDKFLDSASSAGKRKADADSDDDESVDSTLPKPRSHVHRPTSPRRRGEMRTLVHHKPR
ncbi:hypothetical protein D0Z00_002054 [Geotrichum galactomycetum]|uniref:Uncharacterized protein n=1 Tax=Geotrichum galactomycetum TaxID=27317 RepID=A0ACB6V5G0_9ASCO|nr:hypothetical protein D0Z00_002054 [Geotrichum candidum]